MALAHKLDGRDGLESLLRTVRELNGDLRFPAVADTALRAVKAGTACDHVALFLRVDGGLRCIAVDDGVSSAGAHTLPSLPPVDHWLTLRRMKSSRQPEVIPDTAADSSWPDVAPSYPGAERISTWLGMPLCHDTRLLGLIGIGYYARTSIASEVSAWVGEFSLHASVALKNAVLFAEEAARARVASLRNTINESMRDASSTEATIKRAVAAIGKALSVSWCGVFLLEDDGPTAHMGAFSRPDLALDDSVRDALQAVTELVGRQARAVVMSSVAEDFSREAAIDAHRELLLAAGVNALCITPLNLNGQVIGTLVLVQIGEPRPWTSAETMLCEQVSGDLSLAIAQARAFAALRQNTNRLEAERDSFETAVNQSLSGIVIADVPPLGLRFWNSAAAQMAVSGSAMSASVSPEPPRFEPYHLDGSPYPIAAWPLTRAFREGTAIAGEESWLRRRDGSFATVRISASPTMDSHSRVTGVIVEIHDVTHERQMEHHVAAYDTRLRCLIDLLSDLTAGQDISSALVRLSEALKAIIPCDAYAFHLAGAESAVVDHTADVDISDDANEHEALATILQEVVRHVATSPPASLRVDDLPGVMDGEFPQPLAARGLRSALVVPIGAAPVFDGAIGFFSRADGAFSERDLLVASQLSQFIALLHKHRGALLETRQSATRDERDRLARELHDVLAQTITSVVLQLESVLQGMPEDDPARGPLELARSSARSAVAETRRVVWNLRSSNVNLEEPHSAVNEEAAKLVRRLGIKPEVVTTGEQRRVAPEVGAVIQRLARVALDNVWTHSEAKNVRILLDFGLHAFTLLIEDDGKGFDPDEVDLLSAGRVGLAGVAERARVIGGSLRIESAADQGTRVWANVPYAPTAPVPKVRSFAPAPAPATVPAGGGAANRIRVVLIDDHSMVREGLEHMLSDQQDLQVVGAAANGSDGLRIINELHPDVVLCDLQLPDISGVEVISRVRTLFPDIRCVIVTTYDHDDFIYEGIKSGAKGYVLKDVTSSELGDAVRAAYRNESLLQPVVAGKLLERFGEMARQGDMVEPLTDREIGVLRALATGSRNKEIALQLSLSESTIKTHLASIFGKLGVTTRTEAVTRGREIGLIPL